MNQLINEYCKKFKVKKWQIADCLGIADTTFSKMLRKELPQEKKAEIISIIKELAERTAHAN